MNIPVQRSQRSHILLALIFDRPEDNKGASIANTATSNAINSTACEGTSNTSKHERQGEHASCMDSASSSSSEEKVEERRTQQSALGKDPRFRNGDALLPEALEKAASVLAGPLRRNCARGSLLCWTSPINPKYSSFDAPQVIGNRSDACASIYANLKLVLTRTARTQWSGDWGIRRRRRRRRRRRKRKRKRRRKKRRRTYFVRYVCAAGSGGAQRMV